MITNARSGRGLLLAAACAAILLGVGCGDSEDEKSSNGSSTAPGSGSGFLAKSESDVARARRPLTKFTGPEDSPGAVPEGKKVVAITCTNVAALCLQSAEGFLSAAEALGWQASLVDGKGTPQGWTDAVNTAVSGGADAVYLASPVPSQIPQAIARAKAAGVPVVSSLTCEDKLLPGVINQFESSRYKTSYTLGQWIVQKYPAGAEILEFNSPQFNCFNRANEGFEAAIKDAGSKYKIVDNVTSPLSDTATPAGPQRIASLIRSHPDAKAFFVMSETWAGIFQQAVQQTGNKDITGLGMDGDFFVPEVRKGANFVMAGPDTAQYGWWVADALIRYFNKKPQVKGNIPFQLIDSTNVQDTDGQGITADFNYQADWKKLWGVG